MPEKDTYALLDVNGGLLDPKDKSKVFLVDRPVDPFFRRNLHDLLSQSLYTSYTSTTHHLFFSTLSAVPTDEPVQLNRSLSTWAPLGHNPKESETKLSLSRFWWELEEHFKDFKKTPDIGLLAMLAQLADITSQTGIPYYASPRFRQEFKSVWHYFHPEYSALLSPHKDVSGIHIKLSSVGILGRASQADARNVIVWEDDRLAGEWLASFYNILVFMKPTEEQVKAQRHLAGLPWPDRRSTNGQLKYGVSLEEIVEYAKNPNFSNLPQLEYHF